MSHIWRIAIPVVFVGLILAACSSGPRQIASFPSSDLGSSGAGSSDSLDDLVYSAYLEITVTNTQSAAERAEQWAYDCGGFLSSSQFFEQDGKIYSILVIQIPSREFDPFRERLLRLGRLENERVDGKWVDTDHSGWESYSQVILSLEPAGFDWPAVQPPSWRPLRTLEHALQVSLSILGFLVDVLIWVVVVAGPFVLLGWGLKKLIPRLHR
jgi:hypothetical protein